MNPRTRCIALLVVVAALLSCQRANAATVRVQVGQGGLKFTPRTVFIQPGDTVQWVWAADGHSSTSGTPRQPRWAVGFRRTKQRVHIQPDFSKCRRLWNWSSPKI